MLFPPRDIYLIINFFICIHVSNFCIITVITINIISQLKSMVSSVLPINSTQGGTIKMFYRQTIYTCMLGI